MMKEMMTVLLAAALIPGCQKPPAGTSGVTQEQAVAPITNRIETPVKLPSSDLLGLSESEVLKKEGLEKLNPEHGTADQKWYSGGIVRFPSTPGDSYVIERCHVLTFKNGKVVKHEMVDRATAHVTVQPKEQ
jgi:hypothetical protein